MRGLTVGPPVVVTTGALAGRHSTLPRGEIVAAYIQGFLAMAAYIHGLLAMAAYIHGLLTITANIHGFLLMTAQVRAGSGRCQRARLTAG